MDMEGDFIKIVNARSGTGKTHNLGANCRCMKMERYSMEKKESGTDGVIQFIFILLIIMR